MWVSIARRGRIARDPGERLLEMGVARMRPLAQAVDQPDLDPGQRCERRLGQAVDVGRVGEAADPEAPARQPAVLLLERSDRERRRS